MIKRLIYTFIALVFSINASAKSMEEIWNSIPDSIIPYIDRNHRLEMTEFIKMGLTGDVDNMLSGKSIMDTITTDYIHLTLNGSTTMELKRLPYIDGDSMICVVTTWSGPEKESDVRFYTQLWQHVDLPLAFDGSGFADLTNRLTARPDTMSQTHYEELVSLLDPIMVYATLSPENNELRVNLSAPLLQSDQRKEVAAIARETIMTWNGNMFESK